jgi:hypothetical protein
MDIDTIIEELNELVRYRGQGGLVGALAEAPRLLRQHRYQGADDPHELLAKDIKTAIARLPKDLQREAKGLLRIGMSEQYINNRMELLGKEKYSGDARYWHRIAVLGRVAGELIKRWDAPSYRVLDLGINVWQDSYAVRVGVGPTTHVRNVEFRWKIESLVSDLRWFAFSFRTPRRLKYQQFTGGAEGYGCDSVMRVPVASSPDTHWYILSLSDPLPFGVPVELHAQLLFHKASKADPQLDYVPTVPMKSLSLSFTTGWEDSQHTCVELDDEANQVLREFQVKRDIKTTEYDGIPSVETVNRFRVRSPQIGRCYRLEWAGERFL